MRLNRRCALHTDHCSAVTARSGTANRCLALIDVARRRHSGRVAAVAGAGVRIVGIGLARRRHFRHFRRVAVRRRRMTVVQLILTV
jgi:hypothetical protein